MRAERGFDPAGDLTNLPAPRLDSAFGVFADYGLTDRLGVQIKGDWQTGRDAFVDYDGRGPIEIGVNWQVWRDDRTAVSLYGGYADGGEGRNAGYAPPGQGARDWEVRAAAGRSLAPGRLWPEGAFVEAQAARRVREGLPDEVRLDATFGAHVSQDWLVMGQAFGGATDDEGARWLSLEVSAVRRIGDWSLQAGWRRAVGGRETPEASGPVIAVWKRF